MTDTKIVNRKELVISDLYTRPDFSNGTINPFTPEYLSGWKDGLGGKVNKALGGNYGAGFEDGRETRKLRAVQRKAEKKAKEEQWTRRRR